MEQNTKQLIELLMQGVQDEMNSAYNYIALAGRHGKTELPGLGRSPGAGNVECEPPTHTCKTTLYPED